MDTGRFFTVHVVGATYKCKQFGFVHAHCKEAASSRYCIDFATMASMSWHVTYKSDADACGTEASDGRIPA